MKKRVQDKILLYRIQVKKDPEAYAQLYDAHVSAIYRFVYLKVSHKQDAEDITSDVFLKAWGYLTDNKEKDISSLRGLLYTIARNNVVDFYRSRAKQNDKETDIDEYTQIKSQHNMFEDVAVGQEASQLLRVIKTLKQEYQEVVLLKYIEEFSTKEISAITGKSKTSVRVTLHRALKKLKELLESQDES